MQLAMMIRNIRQNRGMWREDLMDFVRHPPFPGEFPERERACVEELRQDGFAVIKNYWPREKALEMRDRLEAHLKDGMNRDFESGAYMRFWDKRSYDEGVRRIYHVERLVEELKSFRNDPFILRVAQGYYGFPMHSGALVYQHNIQTNSNTRYYHIDWFGKQFKPFLYLDDVDAGNGPFTYLRGTHRSHWIRIKKQILGNREGSPTSFYEEDLHSVLDWEVQICGEAGTLILADVRGIHRGSPQVNRSRSVLVNYMYRTQGDVYLDR